MTRQVLFLMVLTFAMFVIAGIILNRQLRRDAMLAARVRGVQRSVGIEAVIAPTGPHRSRGSCRWLPAWARRSPEAGCCRQARWKSCRVRLSTAGFRGRNALAAFIGAKLLALGGLPLLCWMAVSRTAWSPSLRFAAIAGAGVAGLLLPDYVVRTLHKRHLKAVERGLPDALDMLVICSEAGLGLEPAIERVGREIGHAHQDVAEELLNVAREMRVNADRRAALMNMGSAPGLRHCSGSASRWCRRCNTARRSVRRCEPCRRKCGRRR